MSSFESSREGVSSFSEGRAFFFEGVHSPLLEGCCGNGDDGTTDAATASASAQGVHTNIIAPVSQ